MGPVRDHPLAAEAMQLAILGIFCVGFVVEPIAIVKALKARRAIESNPGFGGQDKARAALVMAIAVLVIYLVGFIGFFF